MSHQEQVYTKFLESLKCKTTPDVIELFINAQPQSQLNSQPWVRDHVKYPRDRYEFVDELSGKRCEIVVGPYLNWCGRVFCDGDSVNITKLSVHGGINYKTQTKIGFDTSHNGDLQVVREVLFGGDHNKNRKYWTFEDTKVETIKLARQLSS